MNTTTSTTVAAADLRPGDHIQVGTPPASSVQYLTVMSVIAPDAYHVNILAEVRGWGPDSQFAFDAPVDREFVRAS